MFGYDGSIRIKATLNHNPFDRGIRSMVLSIKGLTGTLMKLAGAVGIALGIGQLVKFGKESIKLASDVQEVQNVIDVTFGKGAAEIEKFAQSAAEAFGLSELSAKQYTGTLGAMLKSSGLVTKDAQDMSIALTGLAGDIASFYNLDTDTAFEKIRSGISGETEPLKQLGINMSVANLEAYALSKGITKSYNAMSQAEQVMLRYNYLLHTTTDAQGDFARTSGSFANQIRILQLNFDQLKIAVGNALIPIAQAVLPGINAIIAALTRLARVFAKVTALLFGKKTAGGSSQVKEQEAIASSGTAAAGAADKLADATAGAGEASKKAAKDMKGVLASFDELNILADQTAKSTSGAAGGIGDAGGAEIEIPEAEDGELWGDVEISPKLVAEIEAFKKALGEIWDVFKKSWEKNGPAVTEAASLALKSLYELAKAVGRAFTEAWTGGAGTEFLDAVFALLTTILDIIAGIADAWKTAFDNKGVEFFESILFHLTSMLNLINSIGEAFREAWNSGAGVEICETILSILTNINDAIGTIYTKIQEAWEANGNGVAIWTSILNIVETVLSFVDRLAASTLSWAQDLNLEPLVTSFRNLLEAVEPLVEVITDGLAWAYENVLLPLAKWAAEELAPAAVDLLTAALNLLTDVIEDLKPFASWLWDNFLKPAAEWSGDLIVRGLEALAENLDILIPIILGTVSAVESLNKIVELAKIALNLLSLAFNVNPIYLWAAAIGAVIGIIIAVITHWDELKQKFGDSLEPIEKVINTIRESLQEWFDAMQEGWNTVIKPVLDKIKEDFVNVVNEHVVPMIEKAVEFIGKVAEAAELIWNTVLKPLVDWFIQYMGPEIAGALELIGGVFNILLATVSDVVGGILEALGGVIDFVLGVFTGDWDRAWNGIVDIFNGVWNAQISIVEGAINLIIKGINFLISKINNMIGDGILAEGLKVLGLPNGKIPHVSEISLPRLSAKLPRLAKGAVIPPNQQFAAILGDQRSGKNIESPVREIELAVMRGIQAAGGGGRNPANVTIVLELDKREFGRAVYSLNQQESQRVGVRLAGVNT